MNFSIGQLSRLAGCKNQTIRYYEQIGLLTQPVRTAGNQRRFDDSHMQRLKFIRHCRELGFSLSAVRELLNLWDRPNDPCTKVDQIAGKKLLEVECKIKQLFALKVELENMITCCEGKRVASCRVLKVLADHNLCLKDSH